MYAPELEMIGNLKLHGQYILRVYCWKVIKNSFDEYLGWNNDRSCKGTTSLIKSQFYTN